MTFLVAHVGAGNHSPSSNDRYKKLLKSALRTNSFVQCSSIIEKSPLTNTGYGSALDRFGDASCDCTVLTSSDQKYESLSLIGIDDKECPTLESLHIKGKIEEEFQKSRSLGLLKPSMLNYQHIRDSYGTDGGSTLILPAAKLLYDKFKNLTIAPPQSVQDTVGVIHFERHLSLSTSSGGTFLKFPGRVSCAGVYGAGLAVAGDESIRISCLCSGNGDDIIKMRLAGFVADVLLRCAQSDEWQDFLAVMVQSIVDHSELTQLSGLSDKHRTIIYAGVIAIVQQGTRTTLAFCHSTESFYFGFIDSAGNREIVLSTQPDESRVGHFVGGQYKL